MTRGTMSSGDKFTNRIHAVNNANKTMWHNLNKMNPACFISALPSIDNDSTCAFLGGWA